MPLPSLRTASIYCLAAWAGVWLLFMLLRFSPFDIRLIPGIGPVLLIALAIAVFAPIVAIGIAGAALARQPRRGWNWLILAGAIAVLLGQAALFAITRWL